VQECLNVWCIVVVEMDLAQSFICMYSLFTQDLFARQEVSCVQECLNVWCIVVVEMDLAQSFICMF